jgi:VWFA-related protein
MEFEDAMLRPLTVALTAIAIAVIAFADTRVSITPRNPRTEASRSSIRIDCTLVLVPVSVTDRSNRPVTGLDKEDFRLFEDTVEQDVLHFSGEDTPVSVGLIFDTSGSIGQRLSESRQAAARLLETASHGDEFFLIEFDSRPRLTVPFTERPEDIHTRLPFVGSAGNTALYDSIKLALSEMRGARNTRKALVVISDGIDNASRYAAPEIRSVLRETDVQLYAIALVETMNPRGRTPAEIAGPIILGEFASETGGLHFTTTNPKQLSGIAARIGEVLRNQYILGYSPANVTRDGKYRRLKVKVDEAGTKTYARPGYYAPAE